jgi:energy-coupling factor transporter ATP-binding protein EcfA2
MRLVAIQYAQHERTAREWRLKDLRLGDINLIVGKNASGKSWTLSIIKSLASLLAAERKLSFLSGHYEATFEDGDATLFYDLHIENKVVIHESLRRGGTTLLVRGPGGAGTITANELGAEMKFQTPENELAAVARRDSIQHPFLEALFLWGKRLYYYPFGTSLGKDALGVLIADAPQPDTKNAMHVVGIFGRAEREIGDPFKRAVLEDMTALGYPADIVSLRTPTGIEVNIELPGPLVGLAVQERGIAAPTEQYEMSQGMFRALSLVVQLNYVAMTLAPSTIVIDDIGEGLDFDRSCALIDLVIAKAKKSKVQLIMATNDRFVMNRVPIEAWSVLRRTESGSRVYNHANSRRIFEEFKYTGLNNFDFLASDFIATAELSDE